MKALGADVLGAAVLGVDVGASGMRAAVAHVDRGTPVIVDRAEHAVGARAGTSGLDAPGLAQAVTALVAALPMADVGVAVLGCAGLMSMGEAVRVTLPAELARLSGATRVVLCSDTLTSYLGALGWQPGVVVAAGTGAVTISADMRGHWRRVDGWGYLVGDDGGGAWIGRAGLNAGLRHLDGRPHGSEALSRRLADRFGDPLRFAGELATRADRPAILASFATDVLDAASAGDPQAALIVTQAARHLADSAIAAMPVPDGAVSLVGGLSAAAPLREAFTRDVHALQPRATVLAPLGTALDGSVRLAAEVLTSSLPRGAEALGAQLTHHAG